MASSLQQRMDYVQAAKVAQQAKQYDQMLESMKNLAKLNVELTLEERDLLREAYKEAIALRRPSVVYADIPSVDYAEIPRDEKLDSELTVICNEAIALIDKHLVPSSSEPESIVLYHTMKGDCHRYLAELKMGIEREEEANNSLEAYKVATKLAEGELPVSNYVRLGVALDMSKLLKEVMGDETSAILLADTAYHEAALEITKESNKCSKSVLVWKMLKKNVDLWAPQNEFVEEPSYLN